MSKGFSLKFFFIILLLTAMIAGIFYFIRHDKKIIPLNGVPTIDAGENKKEEAKYDPKPKSPQFFVSGWLPYWSKKEGVASLENNLSIFSEINPFSFGVNPDGTLRDTADIGNAPWTKLREAAQKENVAIIPTIIWADAPAMHQTFSDQQKLKNHIDAISAMLAQNNFSGVDIDYEGKDVADRDLFTTFLEALRKKLGSAEKTISCTVEARTQDNPPSGWTGTRAMSFANDYSALDSLCDSVRIMAYDQVFQVGGGKKIFDAPDETPTAPNADIRWVEKVMRYAMQSIKPEKLVMGVPTYGWEFLITKTGTGYHYEKVRSVTYLQAVDEQMKNNSTLERTAGEEPFFVHDSPDGKHLVTFSDAESVKQKIVLAKNLGIKGISLFKLDGQNDPQLFPSIKDEAER